MPSSTTTQQKPKETSETLPTLVGWQGLRFTLPPDWNVTGFSTDRQDGYLKVDSPATMFVQVKWTDHSTQQPKSVAGWLLRRFWKPSPSRPSEPPDLKALLEVFMKQTGKEARKGKAAFDYKVKPATTEANGTRTAHNFSWSGAGQGQGKIWHCKECGRVVIAQVVGKPKEPVADVAAQLFSSLQDHGEGGWETWALYDFVGAVPEGFVLKSQKLMSGYLRLEFGRRGERLLLERWGLAHIARKKFTLAEWLRQTGGMKSKRASEEKTLVHGHEAIRLRGKAGFLAAVHALRDALFTWKPATLYDGCCWECPETNKLYAVQLWHNKRTEGLLEEAAARCECH
jgi:hypothetical protein